MLMHISLYNGYIGLLQLILNELVCTIAYTLVAHATWYATTQCIHTNAHIHMHTLIQTISTWIHSALSYILTHMHINWFKSPCVPYIKPLHEGKWEKYIFVIMPLLAIGLITEWKLPGRSFVQYIEMQQYIEVLRYCNIFCSNTTDLGYRYIAHCNIL